MKETRKRIKKQSENNLNNMAINFTARPGSISTPTPSRTIQFTARPAVSTAFKSPSPYGLSGETTLKPAPVKRWGLGWIGDAAQAAYETTKSTLQGVVNAGLEIVDTSSSTGIRLTDYQKAPTSSPAARQEYLNGVNKVTTLERLTKMGQGTMSVANVAFLPVTTQLEAAKEVPILKYPATAASKLFEIMGDAGSKTLSFGLDKLPENILSKQEKDTVRPLVEELGAFTAQMVGIKVAHKVVSKGINIDKLPVSEATKEQVRTGSKLAVGFTMQPFTTAYGIAGGKFSQKIYERKEKGTDITPEESRNIINEIKQELPLELKKEGIFEETRSQREALEMVKRNEPVKTETPKPADNILEILKGKEVREEITRQVDTKIRQSELAKNIEVKAIESGLTKGFDKISEHEVMNMKKLAQDTSDYMDKDYAKAEKIALGEENVPEGMNRAAFVNAIEHKARTEGNGELLYKLANSKSMNEFTSAGQELRTLAERNPDSLYTIIKDVVSTRKAKSIKKMKGKNVTAEKTKVKNSVKKEIKKTKITTDAWADFIDKIKC